MVVKILMLMGGTVGGHLVHTLSHTLLKPNHTVTTSLWEFMVGGQVYTCLYMVGGYGGNKVIRWGNKVGW